MAAVLSLPAAAPAPDPPEGTVDVPSVRAASLEGNLAGDSPDRRVSIYLRPAISPPSPAAIRSCTCYGVTHTFEIYEGNHVNRTSERMGKQVLPFFSANLAAPLSARR
jgi:hypothetical protein